MDLFHTPPFAIYALFAAGLCTMLLLIDAVGGGVRSRTKTTPNEEDAGTVAKGATVAPLDPERVARVMRAHRNALANVLPFLVVMFLYVALGASRQWVLVLCGVFSAMRLAHAVVYIKGLQPWRTIAFAVGQICTGIAVVQVIRATLVIG
jgi:microsomal prostaglandin-E synthase 1